MNFIKYVSFLIFVLLSGCTTTKSDWFAVKNASVEGVGKESIVYGEEISFFKPHRINIGENIVFAYRESTSETTLASDTGTFKKITISIPPEKFKAGEIVTIPSNNVIFSLVFGGSAWPRRSCFSKTATGSIKVVNLTAEGAFLDVDIQSEQTGMWAKSCESKHIQWTGMAKFRTVESLTTFEGKEGTHIYSETYNRESGL